MITAAAPSTMALALPPVTMLPSLKAGRIFAKTSGVVSGRIWSSASTVRLHLLVFTWTGIISLSTLLSLVPAAAQI